jgi:hypothetical protein
MWSAHMSLWFESNRIQILPCYCASRLSASRRRTQNCQHFTEMRQVRLFLPLDSIKLYATVFVSVEAKRVARGRNAKLKSADTFEMQDWSIAWSRELETQLKTSRDNIGSVACMSRLEDSWRQKVLLDRLLKQIPHRFCHGLSTWSVSLG